MSYMGGRDVKRSGFARDFMRVLDGLYLPMENRSSIENARGTVKVREVFPEAQRPAQKQAQPFCDCLTP